jgi:hypothetical protein
MGSATGTGSAKLDSVTLILNQPMKPLSSLVPLYNQTSGAIGWILLWLIGIPLPILLIAYLIKGG